MKALAGAIIRVGFVIFGGVPICYGQEPGPAALLQGVEQARSAVRSGKIDLFFEAKQYIPRSPFGNGAILHIEFDGGKRTCVQQMRVVVVTGASGPTKEANYSRMMAMPDYESAVAAGLGRWQDETIYTAWDGLNFFQYGAKLGASYRPHAGGTGDYVFDPRLLGLHNSNAFTDSLEYCLPYRTGKELRMIGREELAGRQLYHVSIKPHPEVEFHYWIEPEHDFRVHRFEYRASYRTEVVESSYERDDLLPRQVTTIAYAPDRQVIREGLVRVDKMKLNVSVDPEIGTLRSFDMPPGETISDERIGRRLGFWDGKEIVDQYEAAVRIGQEREESARRKEIWRWGSIVSAVGVALIVVGFGVCRRLRRSPPGVSA